jgi:hypothetical protein
MLHSDVSCTSAKYKYFYMRKYILLVIMVVLAIVMLWVASQIAKANAYMLNGDFFTFWLGGRMIGVGEHPYDEQLWLANHEKYGAIWIPNRAYVYPLPLTIIFAPLGILDLHQAAIAWVFLSMIMILLSVALLISLWRVEDLRHYILPVIAGAFTFRPVLVTLRNGQLGALLLFWLALVLYLWHRGRWILGGLLLPFLILKPSIGSLIVGLISIWLMIQRRWKVLVAMVASMFALAISGWLIDPAWMGEYLGIGVNKFVNVFGYSPTIWGMTHQICSENLESTIRLGSGLAIILIGLYLWVLFRFGKNLQPSLLGALGVCVSLLLTPYLWAYDQILLIVPILVIIDVLVVRDFPYLLCASFPILMSGFSLTLILVALKIGYDAWSGLLSLVPLLLLIFMCGRGFRPRMFIETRIEM